MRDPTNGLTVVDTSALAARAAAEIAAAIDAAVRARGRASLACSGGTTPAPMFHALAALALPWPRLDVFQVDERVVPPTHPDRNATQLRDALVGPTALPADRFHAMDVDAADLSAAAARYGARVRDLCGGVIDVVHLGLGDDGHTASLVPGDPVLDVVDRDVAITRGYNGHVRMTLTFPVLDRARHLVWLLSGPAKAGVLPQLLGHDRAIPAGRVRNGSMAVFADPAAAAHVVQ